MSPSGLCEHQHTYHTQKHKLTYYYFFAILMYRKIKLFALGKYARRIVSKIKVLLSNSLEADLQQKHGHKAGVYLRFLEEEATQRGNNTKSDWDSI